MYIRNLNETRDFAVAKFVNQVVCVLALLLMGCGEDETGTIVARVGEVEIGQAEFAAFVERLPPGLRSSKEGREADREHLQSMIDEELMFAEARALGIDTSLAVEHQLREMVRQRLVERYRAQVIVPQVEVTAADVERAFAEMGFDRERLFSRILVRTREELEAVGRDLREASPLRKWPRALPPTTSSPRRATAWSAGSGGRKPGDGSPSRPPSLWVYPLGR